ISENTCGITENNVRKLLTTHKLLPPMTTSPSTVTPTPPTPPMSSSPNKPSSPSTILDVSPLASLPPPTEGEVGSLIALPSGGSSGSSMEIAHSFLSPEDESETGPISPHTEVDLPSLVADIQGMYISQDPVPSSPSPNRSSRSPTGSDPEDVTPITGSMSEFESADDLVPLVDLKTGARKRVCSAKGHTSASKVPCVSGLLLAHELVGLMLPVL
ncbi:hypothetical protein HAX54_041748, partial [Datura stramonium]|nr:hypothetical protein [Datura stramonium]